MCERNEFTSRLPTVPHNGAEPGKNDRAFRRGDSVNRRRRGAGEPANFTRRRQRQRRRRRCRRNGVSRYTGSTQTDASSNKGAREGDALIPRNTAGSPAPCLARLPRRRIRERSIVERRTTTTTPTGRLIDRPRLAPPRLIFHVRKSLSAADSSTGDRSKRAPLPR